MSPVSPALVLEQFIPYLVNVLASRLSRELAGVYEHRFGISIPEWRLIAHLSQHSNVSVREIYERVDMDKAKVSRAAARLETAGLIAKKVNKSDRRLVALQLTRKGRRLFSQIEPLALAYESEVLSSLPEQERSALRSALAKLLSEATIAHAGE
jgi:DNA-binding MarR family transcriptional regulator